MSTAVTRRRFVGSVTSAASATIAAPLVALKERQAQAFERANHVSRPRFKFSLSAYSYRQLFSSPEQQQTGLTLSEFINDCAEMQLDGTELTSYFFAADFTPDYLGQLKRQAFELGLNVSGTAIATDFCHPAGREREAQIKHVRSWIDFSSILGAPLIRIFAGELKHQQSPADAHRLIVDGIEECCDYAGSRGVFLALENHGGPTATAEGLLELINDIRSPWCGVNLDTGNFHGEDVYAELATIAPHAVNVQVKAVVAPKGMPAQPADFRQIARILRDARYRGHVVLEYEETEEPRQACRRLLAQIREAFA